MSESDVFRPFTQSAEKSPSTYKLDVTVSNPAAEVFAVNGSFELAAWGQGGLSTTLPAGSYLIRYRVGTTVHDSAWTNLDQDLVVSPDDDLVTPASSAPLGKVQENLRNAVSSFSNGKALTFLVNDPLSDSSDTRIPSTLTIHRPGSAWSIRFRDAKNVDLPEGWQIHQVEQSFCFGGPAEPGPYLIRTATPGIGTFEICVWVSPTHETKVYLTAKTTHRFSVARSSIHLGTVGVEMLSPNLDASLSNFLTTLTETVRSTLAAGKGLLPFEQINSALADMQPSPILGIMGAHLLAMQIDHSKTKGRDTSGLYSHLLSNIGSLASLYPDWPDVQALRLLVEQGYSPTLTMPPMLWNSWALLAPGASKDRIPVDTYAARIAGAETSIRPWLTWRVSDMQEERTVIPGEIDLQRLVSESLAIERPTDKVAQLLRQTPVEDRSSIQDLADAWSMPQASVESMLCGLKSVLPDGKGLVNS